MDINKEWMNYLMESLKGVRIRCSKWVYEDWDHDHCTICSAKINVHTEVAYCTEDYEQWICTECHKEFMDVFEWVLVEEEGNE